MARAPCSAVTSADAAPSLMKIWTVTFCSTDSSGACQVKTLQTGEYLAVAFLSAESGDLRDPELLSTFAKQAKPIKLAKGESATLELKAIPLD